VTAVALSRLPLGQQRLASSGRCGRWVHSPDLVSIKWFWAFAENPTFVVLHLDGDCLYGWPDSGPIHETGHFAIAEPDGSRRTRNSSSQVEHVLIPVRSVQMVSSFSNLQGAHKET
jgi:hypothetical protein